MDQKCANCGRPAAEGAQFCANCGGRLTVAAISLPTLEGSTETLPRLQASLAGKYDVYRELGRGGMATVYLAKDVKHAREVAIKVLHPELAASIGGDRFEREIRLAANLQHPHILGLYDSGSADGLLYYVMPFVDGESLRSRLDREGQLPVDEALRITLEVANALGHAHQRGIVHRDIKPENILLTQDHSLVADFGIARAVSEVGTQKLTQTGMALGTPLYMAPEQAVGEEVGPSADLYSLGCVLYEMLSGEPPFTGKNAMAIMARHAMEQVPSIRIVRSAVPEPVEEAIFAVLGKVPADRPQTAAAFAELMDMPLGSTATMRIRNLTAARRTPPVGSRGFLDEQPAPWWKGKLAIAAMALVLLGGAGGAWQLFARKSNGMALSPDARRIAVMYFADQSKDKSLQAAADGLTEGLIRSLQSAPSLTVISRSGVEPFRNSDLKLDSIARALRVGYIVRGEVEPEGKDVRVSVSLDDASGFNIKRSSFVRPAANILALSDTLTVVAADMIKQTLHEEIALKEQRGSTSPVAWLLLQRGEQAHKKGEALAVSGDADGMNASFAAADSLYAQAEKEDPRWADPIIARATLAYRHSRLVGRDAPEIRKWVTIGMTHANRALTLDPQQSDALEVRGNLQYWSWLVNLEADPTRAKALLYSAKSDLEQATKFNPRQAGAYASLSHLYHQTSTNTDINIAAQRALEADEFLSNADVILGRLFLSSYELAQFDKAEQWCGEVRRRFPASNMAVQCQLYQLTGTSKNPDVKLAWKLADSLVALAPAPMKEMQRFSTNLLVAAVLGRASKQQPALADSARSLARRSEGDATFDATRDLSFTAAFVYNILGDKKNALRSLKDYLAANPQRVEGLREDPSWWFKGLTQDDGFKQLVGVAN